MQSAYLPVLNRQTEIARMLAAELALLPVQRNQWGPTRQMAKMRRLGCLGGVSAELGTTSPAAKSGL